MFKVLQLKTVQFRSLRGRSALPSEISQVYSSTDKVGQNRAQATFLPFEKDKSQRVGVEISREDN